MTLCGAEVLVGTMLSTARGPSISYLIAALEKLLLDVLGLIEGLVAV